MYLPVVHLIITHFNLYAVPAEFHCSSEQYSWTEAVRKNISCYIHVNPRPYHVAWWWRDGTKEHTLLVGHWRAGYQARIDVNIHNYSMSAWPMGQNLKLAIVFDENIDDILEISRMP